jgi:hypothetical protein
MLNGCCRLKFGQCEKKLKELLDNNKYVCTGEYGRNICKFPINNKYYEYKMPTLIQLYHYYDENPEISHNAKADVVSVLKILEKID